MPSRTEISKESILNAARAAIMEQGAHRVTVDGVAGRAGCAKGLVHYHFKTKRGVLEQVAERLVEERCLAWRNALSSASPREAIKRAWALLADESDQGTVLAWTSLLGPEGPLADRTTRDSLTRFAQELSSSTERLFARTGLSPTIPAQEVGWLLGAVIHGMGLQLEGGADPGDLEGAFAAAWLGVLSLFK